MLPFEIREWELGSWELGMCLMPDLLTWRGQQGIPRCLLPTKIKDLGPSLGESSQ